MQNEATNQPVFGFLLTGIGLGIVSGLLFAYAPDYLYGAYEFPSVANAYYWTISLGAPPIIGLMAGMLLDITLDGSVRRQYWLRCWRQALLAACIVLLLLTATYSPVY